jgi:hypothetical protein
MESKPFKALAFVQKPISEKEFIAESRRRYGLILAAKRGESNDSALDFLGLSRLTADQKSRVDHVAKLVLSKRTTPTQLPAKLALVEKEDIEKLALDARIICASVNEVDERFARIHADAPWMSRITEGLWFDARDRASRGLPFGFHPTVIVGPPGGGKSTLARSIARTFAVPSIDVDAGATGGVFELQGTDFRWGGGAPGRITSAIIASRIVNPIVIIDELDAGSVSTATSQSKIPGLFRVLLGLLEPSTARSWTCPYYSVAFDLTKVSFICTSNSLQGIPQALLSRVNVISVSDINLPDVMAFMRRKAAACGLDETGTEAAIRVINKITERGQRVDLRKASRAIEISLAYQNRPTLN